MGGLGKKGDFNMYHWIEDKNFLKNMRSLCSGIVNELVQNINNDSVMEVKAYLIGSGGHLRWMWLISCVCFALITVREFRKITKKE